MQESLVGAPGTPLREVEDRFLACWAHLAALWGLGPAHARIHGLLFLARRPLDAETVERRLGISHGSCSTGLNELVAQGAIRRVDVPGSRRAKYATDPDGWKWLHACARERRRRSLEPLLAAAREAERSAREAAARAKEARTPDRRDLDEARVRVESFARFLEEFSGLVDSFLVFGGRPPARVLRTVSRAAARARAETSTSRAPRLQERQ